MTGGQFRILRGRLCWPRTTLTFHTRFKNHQMQKIVIAGGSGFLGDVLTNYFAEKGCKVVVLSRKHRLNTPAVEYYKWDARTLGYWTPQLEGAVALINLNGKSVDCRYNEKNKQLIYDTRLESTYILGEAIKRLKNPPKVWVNAASATIYRHAMDRDMDEETGEIGNGFSVDVCKKWEQMFLELQTPSTRKVALRTGIVLGKNGGALQPLKNLVRSGLGGPQGAGCQYFSWIHETDFARIVNYAIENENIEGIYNATAPKPVTNREVMSAIRKALHISFGVPLPTWLLHLGASLINTEPELILKSRRVVPGRLLKHNFSFRYQTIDEAIENLT